MFFQINNLWQILGWFLVFAGLIIMNELGRRTKLGGVIIFVIIPCCHCYFPFLEIQSSRSFFAFVISREGVFCVFFLK